MDECEVARIFGEKTFRLGKDYYEEGRVLSAIKLEGRVLGEVLGRERYFTQVTIESLGSRCSCPVDLNCKHGVALMLQFLSGIYVDGDSIMHDLERAERNKLLKILKSLIEENPTLLLSVPETRKKPSDKLEALIENEIKKRLENMVNSGYADEYTAESFANLLKTNTALINKELLFYVLNFLVSNGEQYGYFYDDYRDHSFGEDVFENLCDAFVQKPLVSRDFLRLKEIEEGDDYDLFYPFLKRMVTAENAPKLLAFKDQVKVLLHDESLYMDFLINAGEKEVSKSL